MLLSVERGMELRVIIQGPKDLLAEIVSQLTRESQGRIQWVDPQAPTSSQQNG